LIPSGYFWSDRLVSQFLQTAFSNRDLLVNDNMVIW